MRFNGERKASILILRGEGSMSKLQLTGETVKGERRRSYYWTGEERGPRARFAEGGGGCITKYPILLGERRF